MPSGDFISKVRYATNPNVLYTLQDSGAKELLDKKINHLPLSNCKNILCMKTGTTVKINWQDPGDLMTADGVVLVRQRRTTLVRKQGLVAPANITDGDVIVVSNVVNQYKVNPYTDTVPDETKTYCYKLFPQSVNNVITNHESNAFLTSQMNWNTIHNLVSKGVISSYFNLGDILTTKHNEFGEIEWQIVAFDHPWQFADNQQHHSITLLSRYTLDKVQFDAPQKEYGITDDGVWSSFKYLKYNSDLYFVLDDDSKITSDRTWTSMNGTYILKYDVDRWKIFDKSTGNLYNQQSSATAANLNPYNVATTWTTSATLIKWKKYYTKSGDTYTEYTNFTDLETISGDTYYQRIPDSIFFNRTTSCRCANRI